MLEQKTGILFSGDSIYDGALYDRVYHSDKALYKESLNQLKVLSVQTVHAGHHISFNKNRMVELIDNYLDGKGVIADAASWVDSAVDKSAEYEQPTRDYPGSPGR